MADNQNLQSKDVIAKIFGVSVRRIEQLKDEGIIKGQGRPMKFDLLPTIQAYIRYLSDKAPGREEKASVSELEEQKLKAEVDIKRAKAEAAQMELDELRGKLHSAEDVEEIITDHVLFLRSMLMAMPGKLAVDCASLDKAAEVAARIQEEVYRILNSLTEYKYDPDAFKKRVRERQGWELDSYGEKEE